MKDKYLKYYVDAGFSGDQRVDTERLQDLIKKHDESFNDETGDLINPEVYWASKQQIRAVLGVPSVEAINEAIKALLKRIEELERKFENHRHDLTKIYSGGPIT